MGGWLVDRAARAGGDAGGARGDIFRRLPGASGQNFYDVEVCLEGITITDNAIIPLKERVVDRSYDPIAKLIGMATGGAGD